MFLLLSSLALAGESFLLAPVEIRGSTSISHAEAYQAELKELLEKRKSPAMINISDYPSFRGMPADKYLKECIPGELSGCAFALADANDTAFLISSKFESNDLVEVTVVNLKEGMIVQELISVKSTKEAAQRGSKVFVQVASGTYEAPEIKESNSGIKPEERIGSTSDQEETQEELPPINFKKEDKVDKTLTKADIEEMKKDEGSKEWDQFNMSAKEYMAFINSGSSLLKWRSLKQGRLNKLMIRFGGGLGYIPAHNFYYGRSVFSNVDNSLVESYAWQIPQADISVLSQISIGYGLRPDLDVGVSLGRASGRFSIDLWTQVAGQTPSFRRENLSNDIFYIEPEVSFVPKITSLVKPIASVGLSMMFGRSADDYFASFEQTYPVLNDSFLMMLKLQPGVEMSLNSGLDVWVRSPLSMVVVGINDPDIIQEGGGALPERERDVPGGYSPIGFGVLLGIQTRVDPVGTIKNLINK